MKALGCTCLSEEPVINHTLRLSGKIIGQSHFLGKNSEKDSSADGFSLSV